MSVPNPPTQAIEVLYSDHHSWLRNWLRKRLGSAFDAADLAHDTYVRIMVSSNIPPVDQSRRYLTQIANGLVIDLYRPPPPNRNHLSGGNQAVTRAGSTIGRGSCLDDRSADRNRYHPA